jgi:hypothetical protein
MKRIIWSRFFRRFLSSRRAAGTISRGTRKEKSRSPRPPVRLHLEGLEDRTLLSTPPTFTVNLAGDLGKGSGNSGDIRYVINRANDPRNADAVIQFDTNAIGSNTITLTHGELDISNSINIKGPGAGALTISGDATGNLPTAGTASSRVFNITSPLATVTIVGLTITGGNGSPTKSLTPGNQGGDIFNGGTLLLQNDIIQNGYVLGAVGGPPARGGGVFNAEGQSTGTGAELTLDNTIVQNNEAQGADGMDSFYTSLSGGDAGFGAGGGIYNDSNAILTIQDSSQIIHNEALGGNGGNGLFGGNGGNNTPGAPGGSGGAGGAAMGGGFFNNAGGKVSITGTKSSPIVISDNVAQGGIGGNGDHGGNGGNATPKFLTGPSGGGGGNGGGGGSTLGGGLYNSGSILTLEYAQFAGNQALGAAGGLGSFGGNAGNGGSNAQGGLGGAGGSGGNGGNALGGAVYSAGSDFTILNTQFTTDAAGLGNQAIGGPGNNGSHGGNGGNAGGSAKPALHLGGAGGSGGAGGNGGTAQGGAVFNGGGNVSFSNVTMIATLAKGGLGGVASTGGNGGSGGAGGNGGAAGVGGGGGAGGAAQGGGVYNSGGSLSFSSFTSNNSQANAGNGNAGGNAGVGGHGGQGAGTKSTGSLAFHGGSGAVGGKGGAGGAGGAAQGGGFYNVGGALTVTNSQFTNDSVASGSGNTGGVGGNGGIGGKSGKVGFFGGPGGVGGEGGAGGDAGLAEGGGGVNAGGNATITGSTFTNDLVQAGNGGNGNTGGNGGEGGDSNKNSIATSGSGGDGGQGGAGGSGSTAQGGGLSVTSGTLTISTTSFGGSAALADQVLGGNGGIGGQGGVINFSGAPLHAYAPITFPKHTPNGGIGGIGGAGTTVTGGGLSVTPSAPPANLKVLNSYPGMDVIAGGFSVPPDTQGGAGPNAYVETVNSAVAIFNPKTNPKLPPLEDSLDHFFFVTGGLSQIPGGGLADAVSTYDSLAQRFIVGDIYSDFNGNNAMLLAVSKTNNPTTLTTADWYFYEINTSVPNVSFQDYPGNLGYNADALVFTENSFGATGDVGTYVNAVSISALTSGATLTAGVNLFQNEYTPTQLPLLPRPATMTDAQPNGPMWFIASAGNGGQFFTGAENTIDVVKMTNILSANPTVTVTPLNVNPYYLAVPPLQPDGSSITFNTDSRILNADEVNGLIVADQNVSDAAKDEDNARWYEIDVSSGTPTLVQQGDISGGPGVYDMYPAIAISPGGSGANSPPADAIGISYTQSGTSSGQFMSVYVAARLPTDPLGTMETPPVAVSAGVGTANNRDGREGDMSGINVDPTDGSFWTADEYANTELSGSWGTAISHFTVQPTTPPPRTVTLTNVSSDNNVLVAGNGGLGGKGGLLPNLVYPPSELTRPVGGLCGDGGAGGNASGGGIFMSASSLQIATLSGVDASGNRSTAGSGGQGAIADRVGAGVGGKGGSDSGAGGAGGSVTGAGLADINYGLTVNASSMSASKFNSNTGTAGAGGAGGGQSGQDPNTSYGGNGGNGGAAVGGGIAVENELSGKLNTLALSISGVSASKNQMTAGTGGAGGGAGTWDHDHILGGSGGSGGQAAGGGLYVFASNSAVNTTSISNATLANNILNAGFGADAGPGASATTGTAAGQFATGGDGGDAQGGGLYNNSLNTTSAGTLSISGSTMSGNQLTAGNGALGATGTTSNGGPGGNGGNGGNAEGGGFFDGNSATLIVVNSTIGGLSLSSQSATANSNSLIAGSGGAGSDGGTPKGVSAADGGNGGNAGNTEGGGAYVSSSNAYFVNDTIINNQSTDPGLAGAPGSGAGNGGKPGKAGANGVGEGGGYFAAAGANQVGNSILDLNAATTTGADVDGIFTSLGTNILGSTAGAGGTNGFNTTTGTDIIATQAQLNLGPLLNNGGPTLTDALLNNKNGKSVAIDAGNNALITTTTNPWYNLFGSTPTDQRGSGFPRIDDVNNKVDIGSVELNLPTIAANGLTPSSSEEGSTNVLLTINGSGFQTGATVTLSYGSTVQVLTPTSVSGNQIIVTIPGPLPTDDNGPINVSVGNPDGSGIAGETINSASSPFTITEAPFALNQPQNQNSDVLDNVSVTISPVSPDSLPDVGNFSATGLPDGLSINAQTGVISGTIAADAASGSPKTYNVSVTAYDGPVSSNDTATVSFTWTVNPFALAQPKPQINNEGDSPSLQITSSSGAVVSNYSATRLPPGLKIDPNTGIISGTINAYAVTNGQASQDFTVTVTAGKGGLTASTTFTWTVDDTTPPKLATPQNQANNIGDTVKLPIQVLSSDGVDNFTATGLPTGLSIDPTSGVISGTITGTTNNLYQVQVTATDDGNSTSVSFTWNVTIPFGLINPEPTNSQGQLVPLQNDEGDPVSLQMTPVSGYTATNFSAAGLPPGLTINSQSGLISGFIDSRGAGTYNVTISAYDSQGQLASVSFSWVVADTTRPVLTNPGLVSSTAGQTITHFAIQAVDADPGTFTDVVDNQHTLPPGLSIDPNTGVISGTISLQAAGNYTVTIQAADNGNLSSPMTFLWSVSPAPAGSGSPTAPVSPPSGPAIPPGLRGLATNLSIVSVQNQYPGLVQLETVTVDVTNPNGYSVDEGIVAFQVNGQTLFAPVVNGTATVTFSTGLLDFADLDDYLFAHPLTANYSDGSGLFAPSGQGMEVSAIWFDFFFSLLASQLRQLTQFQSP